MKQFWEQLWRDTQTDRLSGGQNFIEILCFTQVGLKIQVIIVIARVIYKWNYQKQFCKEIY